MCFEIFFDDILLQIVYVFYLFVVKGLSKCFIDIYFYISVFLSFEEMH